MRLHSPVDPEASRAVALRSMVGPMTPACSQPPPPKRNRLHLSGASFAPRAPKELLLCARGVRRAFLDARILCLLKALPGVSIAPRPSAITSLTVHVCRWQVFKHYWSRNGAMPFDGPCILLGPCCAVFQAANHCRLRFCVLVRRLDRASFNCDAHACRLHSYSPIKKHRH